MCARRSERQARAPAARAYVDDVRAPRLIPSKDYARQHGALWRELAPALERAFLEDDPILGAAVARFEAALARAHEVPHAVGLSSGTAALELVLRELGAGPGDEVVTCAHTFGGVLTAIALTGAAPVLVDADERMLLPVAAVEPAIGPRTRAIVAVHLYGHPVIDIDRLAALAAARGVHLVEDCAQAHGARWRGRPLGGHGVAAAMSFHPSKNLGAFGDGGAALTRDAAIAEGLRVARNLGKSGKYELARVARNDKLDTLQAAILEVKLRHLDAWVARRRAHAARYAEGLRGVGDLALPAEHPEARAAVHLYVVRSARRDALRRHLDAHGVRAGLHYPIAAHRQSAHAARFRDVSFPVAERLAAEVLTLPSSHEHTDDEIDRVIELVRRFFAT
jgi:dTDP-3-amino-3,4,6-trideoxy-alpha-D-glucose transaminase